MTEHTNTPELRFPEFKNDWIEKSFGDFTKTNQGLQIAISNRETQYKEGYYFYITNEFLKPNSKIKYYIKNPPNSVIANKDDILMTRTGNTGKVITGVHGAFHNNFFKIKFDNKQYDRLFIYELLKSSKINNKILSLAGTSTIPDLNHSDFYSIKSFIPKYEEQQKLGIFFNKLDRQIELEEKKLELLKQQKRGYMQQIFSQELRFKDDEGKDYPLWKKYKLGDLYKKGKAGGTPKSTESKYYNGEIPFLSISDITEQGKFVMNTEKTITQEGLDNSTAWLVPINSINYAMYASVGYLSINKVEVATSQAIFNMVFEDNNLVEYIYYYLNYVRDKGVLEKLVGTGTQSNLSASIMKSMDIRLPSYHEMLKITVFLSKFDELVKSQFNKVEKLKQRKKGLLQKMFV